MNVNPPPWAPNYDSCMKNGVPHGGYVSRVDGDPPCLMRPSFRTNFTLTATIDCAFDSPPPVNCNTTRLGIHAWSNNITAVPRTPDGNPVNCTVQDWQTITGIGLNLTANRSLFAACAASLNAGMCDAECRHAASTNWDTWARCRGTPRMDLVRRRLDDMLALCVYDNITGDGFGRWSGGRGLHCVEARFQYWARRDHAIAFSYAPQVVIQLRPVDFTSMGDTRYTSYYPLQADHFVGSSSLAVDIAPPILPQTYFAGGRLFLELGISGQHSIRWPDNNGRLTSNNLDALSTFNVLRVIVDSMEYTEPVTVFPFNVAPLVTALVLIIFIVLVPLCLARHPKARP